MPGIAGILKATVGAHEVITTIMLNWIAIWVGEWLFGQRGPLQNTTQPAIPISNDIADGAKLPDLLGDPSSCRGSTIGFFIALGALVVYWLILNRTTLGYEVRAVGFNPEAARYGGIAVAAELLPRDGDRRRCSPGWAARSTSPAGSTGSASSTSRRARSVSSGSPSALLGRNTAVGIFASSLLFGALINGTSGRQLDPTIFRPDLAGNLTIIIQGLVILFVGPTCRCCSPGARAGALRT